MEARLHEVVDFMIHHCLKAVGMAGVHNDSCDWSPCNANTATIKRLNPDGEVFALINPSHWALAPAPE